MKKILLLLFIGIGISASSCKKETVVVPGTITVLTTAKNWVTTDGGLTYTTSIPVSALDDYYQDNGAVLVYNYLGSGEYEELPGVFLGVTYRFTYVTGTVYIDAQNAGDPTLPTVLPPDLQIKIALVQ